AVRDAAVGPQRLAAAAGRARAHRAGPRIHARSPRLKDTGSMFAATTYSQRRRALMQRIGSGLVVLLGHRDSPMNFRDNAYDFRQDASFSYFCGLDQPDLALLLDADSGEETLFADDADVDHEVWTGPLPRAAERASRAGIAHAAPLAQLKQRLADAQVKARTIHVLPAYRAETQLALQA